MTTNNQQSIAELQRRMKAAPLLSPESFKLQDEVIAAVLADLQGVLAAGEIAVYRVTDQLHVAVHPSAQQPGMLQATRYSTDGIVGDSQYRTADDLNRDEGLWFRTRLSDEEAKSVIEQSIVAEAAYQERRAARMAPTTQGMSL